MKAKWTLLIFAAACTVVLGWAYKTGRSKQTYSYQPLVRQIPVPMVYKTFSGAAEHVANRRVHIDWEPTSVPRNHTRHYAKAIGTFKSGNQLYYILEAENKLFVEKALLIEPFVRAMAELHEDVPRGTYESLPFDQVLEHLPKREGRLKDLAARFKAPKEGVDPENILTHIYELKQNTN